MRSRSVFVSIVAHAVAVLAAVIVPLLAASDLPAVRNPMPPFMPAYHAGALPAASPPAPAPSTLDTRRPNPHAAPVVVPSGIRKETPLPQVSQGPAAPGGLEADTTAGLPPGFGTTGVEIAPPPPPPPPAPPTPLRVQPGGKIKPPRRLAYVAPTYPAIAQNAGVQGLVVLEATIDVDGRVQNVRVLRSLPLLDQAAIRAVRLWQYTPTLLNGVPVPVVMTVSVNFQLTR